MKELAQIVAQKAQASLGASGFFFEQLDLSAKKFKTHIINENSFSQLPTIWTEQSIIFIDGGNNTLIDSPSLHVAALKVAIVKQINIKFKPKFTVDTYNINAIISLEKIDEKKKYMMELNQEKSDTENKIIIPDFKPIELNDELIANVEENRIMITIVGHVRQMLEWHFAKIAITDAQPGTIIIFDGSFSPKNITQEKALQELIDMSEKKSILPIAISKSTSLTTTGGYAIGPFLMSHSPFQNMWFTQSLANSITPIKFAIHFAKLAGKAEHIVRVDIPTQVNIDLGKVMGMIAWISQDASFPGYPYGLIKADDQARVSQEEREYQVTRLLLSLDPLTQRQIRMIQSSSSAHSVLDSLKF